MKNVIFSLIFLLISSCQYESLPTICQEEDISLKDIYESLPTTSYQSKKYQIGFAADPDLGDSLLDGNLTLYGGDRVLTMPMAIYYNEHFFHQINFKGREIYTMKALDFNKNSIFILSSSLAQKENVDCLFLNETLIFTSDESMVEDVKIWNNRVIVKGVNILGIPKFYALLNLESKKLELWQK